MTHRLMLEAREHDVNCFLTLTIREECYEGSGDGIHGTSVLVREAQNFLKRLRVAQLPRGQSRRFRYYLVGEYGDDTGRAHYHVAMFGFGDLGLAAFSWPYGRVQLDELNEKTAAYICGYIAEKSSDAETSRVAGRAPEFARMSLGSFDGQGGLGAAQADRIAQALGENRETLPALADVPASLTQDGKSWPLGRYLQGRVRSLAGYGSRVPEAKQRARAMELVAEATAKGSTSRYVQWKEARRKHDAVKARLALTRSSKKLKGSL